MPTFADLRRMYDAALDDATELVGRAAGGDLTVPSPCDGWDLAALLGHMLGQNRGFARAVADGTAPASSYDDPGVDQATLTDGWAASASALRAAFAAAGPDAPVELTELGMTVTAEQALRMQLLDTAVHAWDVATSLGDSYLPAPETVALVHDFAELIAARGAGSAFAPQLGRTEDPWPDALRLLGRSA